jgi:hypothetical protein
LHKSQPFWYSIRGSGGDGGEADGGSSEGDAVHDGDGVASLEAWAAWVRLEEARLTPFPLAMVMALWRKMAVLMAVSLGLGMMPGRVAILAVCAVS